jgi:hypothetical protein
MNTKKRSRKAYTKKSKKLEDEQLLKTGEMQSNYEQKSNRDKNGIDFTQTSAIEKTTNSVKFSGEVEELGGEDENSMEANNDCTMMNDINIARLTNKKK